MLIDVNAYLGHFAFRQLRHSTSDGLLRLMDRKGIDRAAVSSASAITYRNVQSGNEEVAFEVKAHCDRLVPLAVINPLYAGWRDDLQICHQEFGMKGLRLYPKWHNYKLTDPACLELIAAATERQMAVSIPLRAEDARQRSWLADVPDVALTELVELVKACPSAQFIFVNGMRFDSSPLGQKGSSLPANYAIDLARVTPLMTDELGKLLGNLGADHMVFGSGMPFHYPDPALLNLEHLAVSGDEREKIRWKNAVRLFRL
jgi:uncharacterized protein